MRVKFLLDTHLLLWAAAHPSPLSATVQSLIEDPQNVLVFSVANLWEISIKRAQGREEFAYDPRLLREELLANDYVELAIASEHAIVAGALPPIHKDPFDRLLVAQATVESMTLLTVDREVAKYAGPVRLV